MTGTNSLPTIGYDTQEGEDGRLIIRMKGRMDASNSAPLLRDVEALYKGKRPSSVTVDMEGVTSLDDFGALILVELRRDVLHEIRAHRMKYFLPNRRPELYGDITKRRKAKGPRRKKV